MRTKARARRPAEPGPGAPVYEIDAERFARGARTRSPAGDLFGIAEHLDHVAALGAGAIALTPIFESAEGRAEDTIDYGRIARRVGGERGLSALLAALQARRLGLVLDARFTHCADQHPWFVEARRGARAAHRAAFVFDSRTRARLYRAQAGRPCWNLVDPEVARLLFEGPRSALVRWTRRGATGWRLGGAADLGPQLCARVTDAVHALGGRHGVVGEVTGFARDWLEGGTLDGVTNHVFRATVVALVRGEIPPEEAAWVLDRLAADYPREGLLRSWTVLGTADAPRLATLLGEDAGRLRLAVTLQYAYPGVPFVHWGDEVGLTDGGLSLDTMPWTEDRWNLPLLELHRRLGGLRARWPALAGGGYVTLHQPGEPEILAFARTDPDPRQTVICIANPNARRTAARLLLPLPMLPDGLPLRDLLADRRVTCREGFVRIELEQWDVALLVPEPLAVPGYDFYAGALGS